MKKMLIINLGWEQEPLIDHLNTMGFELYGIHHDDKYYQGVDFKDVFVCDYRDISNILDYADKIQPDAVISDQCDYSQFAQVVIAEKYALPGPALSESQISCNKYIQRLKSKEAGVLIPEFCLCTDLSQVYEFFRQLNGPMILKPVDNRGSFGVNKIENKKDIPDAFFDAIANSHSRYVLAEEFIVGVHITVDGYAFPNSGCKSLALATKQLIGTKRQVAMDIIYPGEIDSEIYVQAMDVNEQVNQLLGYRFGMTHSEYMITENNHIYLIESANRGGGCFTSEIIVPSVCDINLLDQYVNDALGNDVDLYPEENKISKNNVILKFFSFSPGKVKQINGIQEISNDPGTIKFRLIVNDGDVIQPITTDANRHGFIIYSAKDNIRHKVEELLNKMEVMYE